MVNARGEVQVSRINVPALHASSRAMWGFSAEELSAVGSNDHSDSESSDGGTLCENLVIPPVQSIRSELAAASRSVRGGPSPIFAAYQAAALETDDPTRAAERSDARYGTHMDGTKVRGYKGSTRPLMDDPVIWSWLGPSRQEQL